MKFTIEQIKAAHAKVKSGADFPAYIREISALGVAGYDSYVADGHVDYYGADGYKINAPARYSALSIADTTDTGAFKSGLVAHQQGKTDYTTFVQQCASWGVDRWRVSIDGMTCTYFDKKGTPLLVETIPG